MKAIDRLLFRLTARRPARLIKLNGKPYLERYFVGRLFGVTFYLHRFVSSDRERFMHNHPWTWARSLILSGWYDEEVATDITTAMRSGCVTAVRRVRWWNSIAGSHFHRVLNAPSGTWTLFFFGARQLIDCGSYRCEKGWGFLELGYQGDVPMVVYKAWESAPTNWYLTAPPGRDIGREPLL